MLYINISDSEKLVSVKRIKQKVKPGDTVDLDEVDVRLIGGNGPYIVPAKEILEKRTRQERRKRSRARKVLRLAKREGANKPNKKTNDKTVKKASKDGVIKRAVKKITGNKAAKDELKSQRKELEKVLSEMNKGSIMTFSEDVLGIDAKWKDKKEVLIKKALDSAKKFGYKKALKEI